MQIGPLLLGGIGEITESTININTAGFSGGINFQHGKKISKKRKKRDSRVAISTSLQNPLAHGRLTCLVPRSIIGGRNFEHQIVPQK